MLISAKNSSYKVYLVFASQLIYLISSERFVKEDQENRNYLGVFTIVKFSNDACQGEYTQYVSSKLANFIIDTRKRE